MAEKRIEWTQQQRRAIDARGGDVLVAASAGTGKTAVLSGRCVSIVSDKSLCPDIRSVLVLTFTEAAAEQMRSRIAEKLKEAYLETRDPHLRRQLVLLQGADISTIHAFCKRLITEFFYKLELDPTFGVIDGDEQRLLKSEVLERTIDRAWEQENLRTALEQLFDRRDLRAHGGFPSQIVQLSDFLDGIVSRDNWCERAAALAQAANPFTTDLGQKQKQIVADKLRHILAQIQYAIRLYESESAGGDWAAKWRETFVGPITEYVALIDTGPWEEFSRRIKDFQRPARYEYKPRGMSGLSAETIKGLAESARKSFDGLFDLAILNPDYVDRLGGSVSLQTAVLVELVRLFDRLYAQAKRTINCLDFADLEHYAMRLLTDPTSSDGVRRPSETALMLRQRYRHVFVDEYQDINSVQQAILDLLSPGGNTLGVGDIKQSIYAFRGAQPDIFLEQLNRVSETPASGREGLRVDLNTNFRSAKGILDFVNEIFSRVMTASSCRIDYDESAQLKPAPVEGSGSQAVQGGRDAVELHILDEAGEIEDSSKEEQPQESNDAMDLTVVNARQRQAALIARRIRQMVGADGQKAEFQIFDKQSGGLRDVQYRDIVVLMRSLAKKANDYVEIFRLAGVPVSCQATAGYFEATEITDLTALLKVLDNPQRDIELAAVLRSPFFKVTDTELARIKLHGKADESRRTFYDYVVRYADDSPERELAEKLSTVLARLDQWRTAARHGSLADLIWRIYRETGFLSFVSALPSGQARRANLLKLHDRAIQFEGFAGGGAPSLTRFVEFIEKLQEAGQDWAPAEPAASAGNAVRILSVHKSKGLEFPVVFLAELESQFNRADVQADCLADADDTLGLQVIDRRSDGKLSSLAHQVIAERKLLTSLAEEMRILYVATTRARERLILTAAEKRGRCGQIISSGFLLGDQPIPDWQLRSCRNPLQWVLYGLSSQPALHEAFGTGLADRASDDGLFKFSLHGQAELRKLSEFVMALKAAKSSKRSPSGKKSPASRKQSSLLDQVKQSLAWGYPFGLAPLLPAKSSVTQLTHNNDEFVHRDYARALERRPSALTRTEPQVCEPLDARLIGTATHLVISELSFAKGVTAEAIDETVSRLLADGAITAPVAEHIDTASILSFFESEQGGLALVPSNTVWREWPFTFALPVGQWRNSGCPQSAKDQTGDTIVVQGIIDMLIRTPRGLVVIDFKTDRVAGEQVAQRAELYRRQLELYSRAACAILKAQAAGRWLYFLRPRVSIEV